MPLASDPGAGRSGHPGRFLRRAGLVAGVAAGAVLLLALAVYAAWPWLAGALAPRLAPALGLDALAVSSGRPGPHGLRLVRVHARRGGIDVTAEDVQVRFHAAGLAAGRIDLLAVDTLTLTLLADVPGAAAAADGPSTDPPQPAGLLAAVPAERASVDSLRVLVPAQDFRAAGRLALDDAGLAVELTAETPQRARGLVLRATLSRGGSIDASLIEDPATGEADERLSLTARVRDGGGAARLEANGRLDLRGIVLELLTAAGLPDGIERLRGDFEASLPWPVPADLDWSDPQGRGTVSVAGRLDAAVGHLDGAELDWRLGGGRLGGTVRASLQAGSGRWAAGLEVAEWHLPDRGGHGAVTARPADAAADVLSAAWRADADGLAADGTLELSPQAVEAVLDAFDVDGPAGSGELRVKFQGQLTRPATALAATVDADVSGNWALPAPGPGLRDIEGRWRLDGRGVTGDLRATVAWRDLATRMAVTVAEATLAGGALAARGDLAIGGSAPLDFELVDGPEASRLRLDGSLDIGPALLDGALTGWTTEADLTAGRVELDMDLGWPDPMAPGSRIVVGLDDVSAYYGEYVADGISAELTLRTEAEGWRLLPAPVTADRVATGVPLRRVRSGVAWSGDVVQVQPTTFELLGGSAAVPAFDYHPATGRARFPLSLDGLDLALILALEGEQISGTGRIDGTLPVALVDHRPSISGGLVRAASPGGRLQVSPTLAGGTGQPGLDFALRALQDFRYDVLEAGVDYDVEGNLALAVRLEGRNPAIEGGRPIHYNVNVTENLPVLLRSLRLESDVTRNLERRLNN